MAKRRDCPICGKRCRVAADGRSGFCKSMQKRWNKVKFSAGDVQPGPVQHEQLPPFLLGMLAWSYRIVGHYIQPTLEEWELDFMRDLHVSREVQFWHRLAFAFLTWHRRRGLPLRSDAEEARLVGAFRGLTLEGTANESEETRFLRRCFEEPDVWDAEMSRLTTLLAAPNPEWSAPELLPWWPPKPA